MALGLLGGLVLLAGGIILTFLSYSGSYIEWRKKLIPMDEKKLIRSERMSGYVLLTMGILQTIKVLINS